MNLENEYAFKEISEINEILQLQYVGKSKRTLLRDIEALLDMKLIVETKDEKYKTNVQILTGRTAASVKGRDII